MLIYPALAATLLFSCGETNKESYTEKSIEAQNEMSGDIHKGDTNLVKRDGTLLPGNIDEMDSVRLPKPVIDVIMKDEALSLDNILSTREFKENAMTYYEVEFKTDDNSTKKITFTKEGKIKT